MSQIYRFRMLSDENDNFVRDFEVPAESSLLDMHDFIIEMLGYDPCITSFYAADEQWQPLNEYTSMDMGLAADATMPSTPMAEARVCDVMHNLHDRLIYLFDNINQRAYYLELVEAKKPQDGMTYPAPAIRALARPRPVRPRGQRAERLDLRRDDGRVQRLRGRRQLRRRILMPWPPPTKPSS